MKLSGKDLLILLGIVVAVIITLTTWVYADHVPMKKAEIPASKKTSLNKITTDILKKVARPSGSSFTR